MRRRPWRNDSRLFRARRAKVRKNNIILLIVIMTITGVINVLPKKDIYVGFCEVIRITKHPDFTKLPSELIVTKYIYRNRTKPPKPICEYTLRNKKVMKNFIGFHPLLYENTFSFYHLKNMYYGNYFCYITDKGENYVVGNNKHRSFPREIIGRVDHLVAGNSDTADNYGDILIGTIARLNQFPTHYLNISYIQVLYPKWIPLYKSFFEARGIYNPKLLVVARNQTVFAENLYTVVPDLKKGQKLFLHHCFEGQGMRDLGRLLCKHYNATTNPEKYCLFNRANDTRRIIANFDEIHTVLSKRYSKIHFTIIIGHFKNIFDAVIAYSNVKWGFMVNGSNMMNCIFMNSGTAICMPSTTWLDMPSICTCVYNGIFLIGYQIPRFTHEQYATNISVPQALYYVARSFQVLKQQHL